MSEYGHKTQRLEEKKLDFYKSSCIYYRLNHNLLNYLLNTDREQKKQ